MSSEEETLLQPETETILDSVPIPIRVPKNHDSNNIIIQKKIPKIINT